jgi:hypothetical protein
MAFYMQIMNSYMTAAKARRLMVINFAGIKKDAKEGPFQLLTTEG